MIGKNISNRLIRFFKKMINVKNDPILNNPSENRIKTESLMQGLKNPKNQKFFNLVLESIFILESF